MTHIANKVLYQTSSPNREGMEGYQSISSGLAAGLLSQTISSPFSSFFSLLHSSVYSILTRSFWSQALTNDTFVSVFKTNLTFSFVTAPQTALKYFTVAEMSKFLSSKNLHPLGFKHYFAIGALSGGISRTVFYPFEVIRRKKEQSDSGFLDLLKSISQNEGFTGFWSDYFPMILRTLPADGLHYGIYNQLRGYFRKYINVTPAKCAILSAISETISFTIQYPFEYISKIKKEEGFGSTMRNIISMDGFFGLFQDYSYSLAMDIPYIAFQTFFMEEAKLAISGMKNLNIIQKKKSTNPTPLPLKSKRVSFRESRKRWF